MKRIEAMIAPKTFDELRDTLISLGIQEMSLSDARDLRPQTRAGWSRGTEYVVWFTPRYRLELTVRDDQVRDCIDVIRARMQAGDSEGGTIVVLPVSEAVRVHAGGHLAEAA